MTEALRGEAVTVFETNAEGWAWAQLGGDRYVGWIPTRALCRAPGRRRRTRSRRSAPSSSPSPDIKSPPLAALPLGARVTVTGEAEDRNARYALIAPAGAIVVQHLAPLDARRDGLGRGRGDDFSACPISGAARRSLGIDCSGLVQVALGACGIAAPRDTDMQAEAVGKPLPLDARPAAPCGAATSSSGRAMSASCATPKTLLHANAHHMAVADRAARGGASSGYARRGVDVTSIRRPVAD